MHTDTAPAKAGRRLPITRLVCVLAGAAALILSGCSGSEAGPTAKTGGGGKGGGRRGGGGGDVPVQVALASLRDVPVELQAIGNVESYATISVKAQVGGQLTQVHFREGDYVKKGDQLFTIDRRPFESALNQATAMNARDEAALAQAQANLARDTAQAKYAAAQADRIAELFRNGIVSREQMEQARAAADAQNQSVAADKAAIESAKAAIGASKAAIENSQIQLGYTVIRSPINGRTGAIKVQEGNVITPNNVDLTIINQVEPIYVSFSVPENSLADIKRYMARQKLQVKAQSQDIPEDIETGTLTFVDNTVDASTGTIRLKATFPNASHKLWPGQFVRVTLRLTTEKNSVVVPNEAVQTGQDGQYVYVVKKDRTAESRPVKAGARVDNVTVIQSGIQNGEMVVTEGQLRLAPGSHVSIRDGRGGRGSRGEPSAGGEGKKALEGTR